MPTPHEPHTNPTRTPRAHHAHTTRLSLNPSSLTPCATPPPTPPPLFASSHLLLESAKCLHGRPEPLKGSYYVNLFTHYRPKNNPEWYREKVRVATQQHRSINHHTRYLFSFQCW